MRESILAPWEDQMGGGEGGGRLLRKVGNSQLRYGCQRTLSPGLLDVCLYRLFLLLCYTSLTSPAPH